MEETKENRPPFSQSALALSLLLFTGTAMSCKGPAGPVAPPLTGDIIGYCILVDSTGNYLNDFSGASVTAEGASPTALTNAEGLYRLEVVPTGTYVLKYEKPGYGTFKRPGFQFVGGGTVYAGYVYLYELPKFSVVNLSANNEGGAINVTGTLTGNADSYRDVMIFLGKSATVSSNPATYTDYWSAYVYYGSSTMLATISATTLHEMGFTQGEPVYLVAYGNNGYSGYLDYSTMKYIFTSLSSTPSNIISIAAP